MWLTVCHLCNECQRQCVGATVSLRMHDADVKLTRGESNRWSRPADGGGLVSQPGRASCTSSPAHWTIHRNWHPVSRLGRNNKTCGPWLTIDGLEASFEGQPHRAQQVDWLISQCSWSVRPWRWLDNNRRYALFRSLNLRTSVSVIALAGRSPRRRSHWPNSLAFCWAPDGF